MLSVLKYFIILLFSKKKTLQLSNNLDSLYDYLYLTEINTALTFYLLIVYRFRVYFLWALLLDKSWRKYSFCSVHLYGSVFGQFISGYKNISENLQSKTALSFQSLFWSAPNCDKIFISFDLHYFLCNTE